MEKFKEYNREIFSSFFSVAACCFLWEFGDYNIYGDFSLLYIYAFLIPLLVFSIATIFVHKIRKGKFLLLDLFFFCLFSLLISFSLCVMNRDVDLFFFYFPSIFIGLLTVRFFWRFIEIIAPKLFSKIILSIYYFFVFASAIAVPWDFFINSDNTMGGLVAYSSAAALIGLPAFLIHYLSDDRRKSLLIVLLIVANFSFAVYASSRAFLITKFIDPCYEEIDGKGYSYKIIKNNVCMLGADSSGQAVSLTFEGADAETFKELGGNYFIDKNNIYYDKNISDADRETFVFLDYGYAKDRSVVFYDGERRENINPDGFSVLSSSYIKNRLHVYYEEEILENADPESFDLVDTESPNDDVAKDKNHVYYSNKIINQADVKTFSKVVDAISGLYYKDKNCVYNYIGGEMKELKGINPATFKIVNYGHYLKDKNNCYRGVEPYEIVSCDEIKK